MFTADDVKGVAEEILDGIDTEDPELDSRAAANTINDKVFGGTVEEALDVLGQTSMVDNTMIAVLSGLPEVAVLNLLQTGAMLERRRVRAEAQEAQALEA